MITFISFWGLTLSDLQGYWQLSGPFFFYSPLCVDLGQLFPPTSKEKARNKSKVCVLCLYRLGVLRTRALLCLQNMSSALELGELGGADLLYSTWVRLGTMIFQNTCTGQPSSSPGDFQKSKVTFRNLNLIYIYMGNLKHHSL